jgi:GNAT superfamily N-acetyltransferase
MSAGDGWDLAAREAQRWHAIDRLLPTRMEAPHGCGAELMVLDTAGRPVAVGTCEHWSAPADSLDLSWGAARRYQLTMRVADLDNPTPLDHLISAWKKHLNDVDGAGDEDTAAEVTWPSRDVGGVQTLLAHGLAPLAVIGARVTQPVSSADLSALDGVRVRRATPADIDEVLRLGLDVVRFDALVSAVTERPSTADALRSEFSMLLAGDQPWVWLAEDRGAAVGMLAAERPEVARWIAPRTNAAAVAYLLLMGVSSGLRGRGVGATMAAHLHREVEAAGVAVTLLHYAQVNPLSAPFWSQQGYRPLWTVWEARPAGNLR